MSVEQIITGMIDLIDKNLVARSNVFSDALTGQTLVNVEDSFHFDDGQEIILIDYDYNVESAPHYKNFEYSRIKEVNNTHWITLYQALESDWLLSKHAFIQKTIGSTPLYTDRIFYGDRDVIPTEDMAITVEPQNLSNEWLYIHGGLSEEYRVSIMIYGKNIETENGMKILNKYTDAVYDLFNENIHIHINDYNTPVLANVAANTNSIVIADNADNRENFQVSYSIPDDQIYEIQDNYGNEIDLYITSVSTPGDGYMHITVNKTDPVLFGTAPLNRSYSIGEYATFIKHGSIYFYDSRIDNIEFATTQKGSAYVRVAKLS